MDTNDGFVCMWQVASMQVAGVQVAIYASTILDGRHIGFCGHLLITERLGTLERTCR